MFSPPALEAFVAVLDSGTVSSAAARLFRTQPTVSRQLAALEAQIGGELFRRSSAGMMPTPLGERLEPLARDLVKRARRATDVMSALAAGQRDFVVACPEMTGVLVLAPFIAEGGAISDVVSAPPDEVYDRLRLGADFAVNTSPPPRGLQGMRLAAVTVKCEVPSGDPFATSTEVELSDLLARPFFIPGLGSAVWRAVQHSAETAGLSLELATRTANAPVAQARAAAGDGPAVVIEPPTFGLVHRPLVHEGQVLTCTLYAAWERGHYARDDIARAARDVADFLGAHSADFDVVA
ncbi:LysR family transcriptional regulator [Microbacterium marinilacus]|uniref:HTH lysR-type domain-containing protein n=1 Tax=Microbacterium marinilacus TaxID=415209 RepID=A0ABP7BBV3_9MICO|nr:LysR family transcriptional regulator [Microbacterium marinilacus]MBY0687039.1 LysR family transcriptional regulator [Microbacterium marinilacus]